LARVLPEQNSASWKLGGRRSRATDVACEAAAVVLLDDNFAVLVHVVRSGRRIVDNLNMAFAYILAVHLPIAGLTLFPIGTRWPLVPMPVHISFRSS
jgi:Ca2+-transporting ATPase